MHSPQLPSFTSRQPACQHQQCKANAPVNLRRSSPSHIAAATAQPKTAASAVREAAVGQQFGASSTDQQNQHLMRLVSDLKEFQGTTKAAAAPTEGALSGDWQLLWTSEASVHSIVRGQLLGAPVTDIQQQVDLQGRRVTNTISFGWLGLQLQASGPLTVLSSSRIYYSFDQLLVKALQLRLPLPVFFKGGGWSDCVLLLDDGNLRVMENSRRDTLVLQRCNTVQS